LVIGLPVGEPAAVDVDDDVGAADEPAPGAAPALCPKIADTMLPKMLMVASWVLNYL
jgi:hypothetical protein